MSHIVALAVTLMLTTAPAVLAENNVTATRADAIAEPQPTVPQGDIIVIGLFAALGTLANG